MGPQRAERGCGRRGWAGWGQSLLTPRGVPDPRRASGAPGCVWGLPSPSRLSCRSPLGPMGRGPLTGAPTPGRDHTTCPGLPSPGPGPQPRRQAPAGPGDSVSPEPLPFLSPGSSKVPGLGGSQDPRPSSHPAHWSSHQPPKHPCSLAVACAGGGACLCPAGPRGGPGLRAHTTAAPEDAAAPLALRRPPSQRLAVGSPSRDMPPRSPAGPSHPSLSKRPPCPLEDPAPSPAAPRLHARSRPILLEPSAPGPGSSVSPTARGSASETRPRGTPGVRRGLGTLRTA